MQQNIQLFLVSGFLGSGKTTFLKNLLTQMNGRRIGVIVNEFGSVGIDGAVLDDEEVQIVEINNGSIFCACLKGGFVRTLAAFLEQPVDYLFVEASGLADPSDVQKLLNQMEPYLDRKPEVIRRYDFRGFICVVDATHFLSYSQVFVQAVNQVEKSQVIILNKIDEAGKSVTDETGKRLRTINRDAYIYQTNYAKISLQTLMQHLDRRTGIGESSNTPQTRPRTYILIADDPRTLDSMREFCQEIADHTVRIKGFFRTDTGTGHVDCVGDRLSVTPFWKENGKDVPLKIVIIGKSTEPFRRELEEAWERVFRARPQLEED